MMDPVGGMLFQNRMNLLTSPLVQSQLDRREGVADLQPEMVGDPSNLLRLHRPDRGDAQEEDRNDGQRPSRSAAHSPVHEYKGSRCQHESKDQQECKEEIHGEPGLIQTTQPQPAAIATASQ